MFSSKAPAEVTKGFDIENVEYFTFIKYGLEGPIECIGDDNVPSPICVNGESVHVLSETFRLKTYSFDVEDDYTCFITKLGLWVNNTAYK